MVTKEELIKESKYVLELYGEPTVASDLAKKILNYFEEPLSATVPEDTLLSYEFGVNNGI